MIATCLLLLALPASHEQQTNPHTGEHFVVTSQILISDHTERALEVAEATWTVTTELLGVPERKLTRGIAINLLLFYGSMPVDVHYSPKLPVNVLKRSSLPITTAGSVANKAAELIVTRIVPTSASFPLWLSEGLAGYVEEETLFALGISAGPDVEPRFAMRRSLCERIAQSKRVPSFVDFLDDELKPMPAPDQAAVRALFFRELANDNDRFKTFVKAIWQISGGADYGRDVSGMLIGVYGPDLWSNFWKYIAKSEPAWEVTIGSLASNGEGWIQHARRKRDGITWRSHRPLKAGWSMDGEFEILGLSSPSARVLLGASLDKQPTLNALPDHIAVKFQPGKGLVVSAYNESKRSYEQLASKSLTIRPGAPNSFRIESTETGLTVSVNDSEPLEIKFKQPTVGAFGLATREGSITLWNRLELH